MGFDLNDPKLDHSRGLRWNHLISNPQLFTIQGVTLEDWAGKDSDKTDFKVTLYLAGAEKPLGLNVTNTRELKKAPPVGLGDGNSDLWIGQVIECRVESTQDKTGAMVNCIRTYVPQAQSAQAPPPPHPLLQAQPPSGPPPPLPPARFPEPPAPADAGQDPARSPDPAPAADDPFDVNMGTEGQGETFD